MTVEELLLYDSTTRKKAPTEVRAILRYMKKKGGENPCLVTGTFTDLKVCFSQSFEFAN